MVEFLAVRVTILALSLMGVSVEREKGGWTVAATYVIQDSNGHSESFVRRSSIDPPTPLLPTLLSKSGRLGMKTLLAKGLTLCGWRAVM